MKFNLRNPYRNLIKHLQNIIKNDNIEQREKDLNKLYIYAQTQ